MNAISPNATTAQRLIFVAVVFPKVDIAIVGWQHSIIKSNMLKHAASMSQLPEWRCCLSYRCRSPGQSIHSTDTTLGICVFVFRKLNNIPKSFIIQQLLRMQPGNHPPTLGWLGNPNQNAYCYQPSIPQTLMTSQYNNKNINVTKAAGLPEWQWLLRNASIHRTIYSSPCICTLHTLFQTPSQCSSQFAAEMTENLNVNKHESNRRQQQKLVPLR